MKKKYILSLVLLAPLLMASTSNGCSDADVASNNLSVAAEQFEIARKVTFYNSFLDVPISTVEGLCSVEFYDTYSEVTCMDDGRAVKNMFQKSDNTSLIVEQIESEPVSTYQYRSLVKPSLVIPDFDIVTPGMEGNSNHLSN